MTVDSLDKRAFFIFILDVDLLKALLNQVLNPKGKVQHLQNIIVSFLALNLFTGVFYTELNLEVIG